ncbi:MAG: BglG family transcription antiterminator [Lawsonibacter sp.]
MTFISPRLNQILRLLVEQDAPIRVDCLAREIGVSRRTVFRELDGVETVLQKANLSLDTIPGEGMLLSGSDGDRSALGKLLGSASVMSPQNKADRRRLLIFLLSDTGGIQKLFYYAQALGVSEATVSTDLDSLEKYFERFDLTLLRRQSQGVELSGSEFDLRRMLVDTQNHISNLRSFGKNYGYPSLQTIQTVTEALEGEWAPKLDWMTEESLAMLTLQLSVLIERVCKGRTLKKDDTTITGLPRQLAGQLCDMLENLFSISVSSAERMAVGTFIRACRAKHLNPLDINDAAAYTHMQNVAYRMIDAFDPRLSPSLKLNEDLIEGLSLHLWSAVVRLKQGIELKSEMQDQLVRDFPEVFLKSKQAAKVIELEYHVHVPDSEIAFIASHFGAALMHYGERSSHHVVLKAGIICVAGIGVSYMMASQVRRRFRGQLEVVVTDCNNPAEWSDFHLLISSIPLSNAACPVVVVKPVLEAEDYATIRKIMDHCMMSTAEEMPHLIGSLPQQFEKTALCFTHMSVMLRSFTKQTIHADCTFDELAKMVGYRFGSEPESGGQIYTDLIQRERVGTQVIPRLDIVLLHARTQGIQRPSIGLISPEGQRFTNPYLQSVKGCLVMLVPKNADKELLEIFGSISGALIEDEILLAAVQSGDEPVVYTRIEAAIMQYLKDYWNEKFDL